MKKTIKRIFGWLVSCVMTVFDALYDAASHGHDHPSTSGPDGSSDSSDSSCPQDHIDSSSDCSESSFDDGSSGSSDPSDSSDSSDSSDPPFQLVQSDWSKSNSFALVASIDYRYDTYPASSVNRVRDLLSESADTVRFIVDQEATAEAFLDALREGLQYETFFFYVNAHGNNKSIRMANRNLFSREVWEVMRNAHNRIVGFFDSCRSGSMLPDPEPNEFTRDGDEREGESFAGYLVRRFEEQGRRDGAAPRIRLYSACNQVALTTYDPDSSTKFGYAMTGAAKATVGMTYARFDEELIRRGSYWNYPQTDPQLRVVPQVVSYGDDFSCYERLR